MEYKNTIITPKTSFPMKAGLPNREPLCLLSRDKGAFYFTNQDGGNHHMEYKNTIITPKTSFPMKAGLPNREPGMLENWEKLDVYQAMLEKNKDCKPFVLHDGPPFSNGDIHMGHALNKTLKDFIVRSHAMQGYYTPYVPGWDNHGMPIESAIIKGDIHMGHALNKTLKDFIVRSHAMQGYYTPYVPGWDNHGMPIESAIIKKNKLNRKAMPVPEFRSACEEFAENYIQRQMAGFKRLGVIGDWEHPYRTSGRWQASSVWASSATGSIPTAPWTASLKPRRSRSSVLCTARAISTRG